MFKAFFQAEHLRWMFIPGLSSIPHVKKTVGLHFL